MNRIITAQECDARDDDQGTNAGNIIKRLLRPAFLKLYFHFNNGLTMT